MAKTIIEQIADGIDEIDENPIAPIGEVPGEDVGVVDSDEDLSDFVPKDHVEEAPELAADVAVDDVGTSSDLSGGIDDLAAGMDEPGVKDVSGATDETPIVEPGETNAAPPSPGSFEPAGVIKVDAPLLIKMLEHAKSGGDVHHLASEAAKMCGDPACEALTMSHFDQLAGATPVTPVEQVVDVAGGAPDIDNGAPDVGGPPIDELGGDEGGDEGGDISDISDIAAGMGDDEEIEEPVGEGEAVEGDSENAPPSEEDGPPKESKEEKPESKEEKPESKEEKPESKDEKGDKKEKKENDAPPFAEGIRPVVDSIVEEFAATSDDEDDKKKEKKKFKKPWEKEEDCDGDDCSMAESIDRLTRLMSNQAKFIFKDTQKDHVVEFDAKPNETFQKVYAESVSKALKNKTWLAENGLNALTRYNKASVVNTYGMGQRHLLVLG